MSINNDLRRFTEFGRKIVGVGFNYSGLLKEMGVTQTKEPRLFLKAPSSYIRQGQKIKLPNLRGTESNIWYEVELGVILGKKLRKGNPKQAVDAIGGFCTALDLTNKNRLHQAWQTGQSWATAKSFDTACPVGDLIPKEKLLHLDRLQLWLRINGIVRQSGCTDEMTWPVPDLVSHISHLMTLEPGDMILTGTPAGIGTLERGETIEAGVCDVDQITFEVDTE